MYYVHKNYVSVCIRIYINVTVWVAAIYIKFYIIPQLEENVHRKMCDFSQKSLYKAYKIWYNIKIYINLLYIIADTD